MDLIYAPGTHPDPSSVATSQIPNGGEGGDP
jgi:hypothetical protein